MRRLTEKQAQIENAQFGNDAQEEPKAKKNQTDNMITNIATLDNDTTVEVFKYLKYCGLAKTSLVSKRFSNLIRTHRHKLALLDVKSIMMVKRNEDHSVIKIFNKELSPEAYNEWIFGNGYSKQIPLETQILKRSFDTETVLNARVELSHENWPVFQHFFRLLTDPLIYTRHMGLPYEQDALVVLCVISIIGRRASSYHKLQNKVANSNEEFYFTTTGANCTSRIYIKIYEPCKLIAPFVQKFMDLKDCDGNKVVGTIVCNTNANVNIDALKREYADFVVEENINETSGSWLVVEFVNNDIGKKLWLNVNLDLNHHKSNVSVKIANM
ncbi:hypothetical protein Ddc_17554 [Ditylenchus destructor]|nr:hypothetical protein Ddc_17554 [Ditylenchus destructor]